MTAKESAKKRRSGTKKMWAAVTPMSSLNGRGMFVACAQLFNSRRRPDAIAKEEPNFIVVPVSVPLNKKK